MARRGAFWGVLLIVLGIAFLLESTGVLKVDVWPLFWALALIALGLSVLWAALLGRRRLPTEEASIALDGATEGHVHLSHGAGELRLAGGAPAGVLLDGVFRGGLKYDTRRDGEILQANLSVAKGAFAWPVPCVWLPGNALDWTVRLSSAIPLRLWLDTGASRSILDLSSLRVVEMTLNTGVSASDLTMPANAGYTRAVVKSGVAAVTIGVPEGVAARIEVQSGVAGVDISTRFPRQGGVYQSPGYETAANRLDLRIETGVGGVRVD